MKSVICLLSLLFLCACTTLKPVELSTADLQEKIASQTVLKVGDQAKIIDQNGERHSFKVTEMTATHVLGRDKSVAIADIVALETKSFSGGKTSALVGVSFLWLYVVLISIPAIVVL